MDINYITDVRASSLTDAFDEASKLIDASIKYREQTVKQKKKNYREFLFNENAVTKEQKKYAHSKHYRK